MGIETKYDYTYYTVIETEQWRRGNEEWLGYDDDDVGFTWENAINFINHKFKTSEDKSVNNYRVDCAGYEQDIGDWIRIHERHKERPVFVQFQDEQQIKTTGGGSLFILYEEEEEEEEEVFHIFPNSMRIEPDLIDGLAGAGGRL